MLLDILQTRIGLHRKKDVFSSKVLILYTAEKLIEIYAENYKIVGSEKELLTSYSRSKILKKLGKITILIPVYSWKCSCCKQSNCIHQKLTFYIKYI